MQQNQVSTLVNPSAISSNTLANNSLAMITPLLSKAEASEIMAMSGELGPDPSSTYFTTRTKNIAYVLCINGAWFQIRAHCFNQPQQYNDFSGGCERCYREMPQPFLASKATQKVLNTFKSTYQIPDNEPILVQVQESHITSDNEGQCLTGQGIHSDGADKAMLVCLKREQVQGAESAIYADLAGKQSLIVPFVLEVGQAMLWHDNRVFHSVQPAKVTAPHEEGSRTVLIAHYPAVHYLNGTVNPNNHLKTNLVEESRQLRNARASEGEATSAQ
ncbi:MAG: 2OG-Fe dioxygenase family protein [Cyanobacteria bacterium P01_A01_bin.114]